MREAQVQDGVTPPVVTKKCIRSNGVCLAVDGEVPWFLDKVCCPPPAMDRSVELHGQGSPHARWIGNFFVDQNPRARTVGGLAVG